MASELLLSRLGRRTWAALREDGTTVELHHEREGDGGALGDVFRGRVTRIVPGIEAAFVDIGLERDAFLHAKDLILPEERLLASVPFDRPIQDRLREGRDLLVQVTREASGGKGARVGSQVSLAGRTLVHLPGERFRGISRKVEDPMERVRLEGILARLPGESDGFVVRTAGSGVEEAAFRADAQSLTALSRKIEAGALQGPVPSLVHADDDLLLRMLRDAPRGGLDRIVVDDPEDRGRAVAYLGAVDPVLASRVLMHHGPPPLLEAHGIDQDLERALRPKVWLRSGGYLVIQPTEALVAVDVNSGKFVSGERPEQTALRTNLEAAAEIARQLRLRDLGGIVVIDFIDLEEAENRDLLLEAFEARLRSDRARTKLLAASELGLVQLTREKGRRDLASALTRACPECSGLGFIRSDEGSL